MADTITLRCPHCLNTLTATAKPPLSLQSSRGPTPFFVCCCGRCGGIMSRDVNDGTLRPLNRAERRQLPAHPFADEVRQFQADVVAKLWG